MILSEQKAEGLVLKDKEERGMRGECMVFLSSSIALTQLFTLMGFGKAHVNAHVR